MEVGQQLLQARQRRKLTLAEISRNTKIPVHTLQAIERDDVKNLPPGFFTRAFVRTYAKEVGIDPYDLLDPVEPHSAPVETEEESAVVADRQSAFPTSLFLLVGAAIVCGVLIGRLTAGTPAEDARAEMASVQPDKIEPAVDRVAAAAPLPAGSAAAVDVEFEVKSHDGCFVAVTADGRETAARPVQPGKPVSVKARGEVVLRVSDAGACAAIEKPATASTRRTAVRSVPVAHVAEQSAAATVPDAEPATPAADTPAAPSDSIAASPAAEQF